MPLIQGANGIDEWAGNPGKDWSQEAAIRSRAAYGSVPVAPQMQSTAAQATAQQMQAQQAVYNQLPGYNQSVANIGKNIQSETAGELPADVVAHLSQLAAERGVAIGSPGSPNVQSDLLSAFGLSSLNMTQMGQQNLQSFLPTLPGASAAANANFYVTPQQQYEAALQASVFAAAPDPMKAAQANMAAAGSGFGAGMGAGGSMRLPSSTVAPAASSQTVGPVGADQGSAGTFYGGSWYPGGTTPTPIDELVKKYASGLGETSSVPDQSAEEEAYYQSPDYLNQ